MSFKHETIPPATVDEIDALIAAALSQDDPKHHLQDFEKVLVARALEAMAMPALDLAKAMPVGSHFEAGGCAFERIACGDPRWVMAAIHGPNGDGFLIAVKTTITISDSPTARAMIEDRANALGPRPENPDRNAFALRIMAEMDAASAVVKELAASGWPDDLPDASSATSWREIQIHAFGADVPPESGDVLTDIAARRSCGPTPSQIAAAIPQDAYTTTLIAKTSKPYSYEGAPWSREGDLRRPYDWRAAFDALRAVLPAEARQAIAANAIEIGRRTYVGYADTDAELAILRAGTAAAQLDDGLPGAGATAVMTALEHGAILASAPALAREIDRLDAAHRASPEKDERGRVTYNDLDNSVAVEAVRCNTVITLTDQNGHFVIVVTPSENARSYAITRTGQDMREYLDYAKDRATDPSSLRSLDVGRDYANARDPFAPLPPAEAIERIMGGSTPFPGFVMSFWVSDGKATWITPPSLALRTIRDLNTVKACVQSGWIELEEDARAQG